MQRNELINIYQQDSWIRNFTYTIQEVKAGSFHLVGVSGSLHAVLIAAAYQFAAQPHLIILDTKEEATYFYSDLKHLLSTSPIFLYPSINKKSDEIAHEQHTISSVRTEILHHVHKGTQPALIVTYAAAMSEQVVGCTALDDVTVILCQGECIVVADLIKKISQQGFEKVDFVYEVGQFSVRGGILDVFSYAYELPFRIELWGDRIETIRTFDPTHQKSIQSIKKASIIPNSYLTKKESIVYQSLLTFLPKNTCVWLKNYKHVIDAIDNNLQVSEGGKALQEKNIYNNSLLCAYVVETKENWTLALQQLTVIEFGPKNYLSTVGIFHYLSSTPQPDFHQNFKLLAEDLISYQEKGYHNIITSISSGQFARLNTIFEEERYSIVFSSLLLGLHAGYVDHKMKIVCYTDHEIFERYYRYSTPRIYSKTKSITLNELKSLQLGDYVVHVDYGIGRFVGLRKIIFDGKEQESLHLVYKNNDLVYVSIHDVHKITKYSGKEGSIPSVSKLGTSEWEDKKKNAKKKVKDIAKNLIHLYVKRKQIAGFSFSKNGASHAELVSSFMYEDTPDQAAATLAVSQDMEASYPMDRLVCGDVGFGKTEIAIRATLKAVNDGKQVVILAPTTILVLQHYNSFNNRLAGFAVKVHYVNRFKTVKEIKHALEDTEAGKVDVLIGTHKILSKSVKFKDLGLLIIDEEQKFGVTAKEHLKKMFLNVDTLTLTATPIPRTLHFSLMGARDLSIIATPPVNRQPIKTLVHTFSKEIIKEAIHNEIQRNGQVFFVHNCIFDIASIADTIAELFPTIRIGIAHSKVESAKLERIILQFIGGDYDLLIATNIIESGLDIPNANTIIINNSHMFGLSDLHQMRGRVGRSNKKAFCYLLIPSLTTLTADTRRRLRVVEEFSDLGDGFKVAMSDLDIRGAGNLLGVEQSGFIADIGFNTYCNILEDAVEELKKEEFADLFGKELCKKQHELKDCELETDLAILIPTTYISNVSERIYFYTKLDNATNQNTLISLQDELLDRFGPIPEPTKALIQSVKLRWQAKNLGISKLQLKHSMMRCYIAHKMGVTDSKKFKQLVVYVQKNGQRCHFKEVKKQLILSIQEITTIVEAQYVLQDITELSV